MNKLSERPSPPSALRVLTLALAAWALYVALRTYLKQLLPAHDWPSYLEQDLAITVGRLSLGLFCLWLARLRYDAATLWNLPGRLGLAWLLGAVLVLAHVITWASYLPQAWTLDLAWVRVIEVAIALVVAFNEEVGYRGTIFEPLRELKGKWVAVAVSTLLFVLMHFGYQDWHTLPKIALIGLAFGLARLAGLSLGQLIAMHFAIDGIEAFYLPQAGAWDWVKEVAAGLLLAATCFSLWRLTQARSRLE